MPPLLGFPAALYDVLDMQSMAGYIKCKFETLHQKFHFEGRL